MKQPAIVRAAVLATMLEFRGVSFSEVTGTSSRHGVTAARRACWRALREAGMYPVEIARAFGCSRSKVAVGILKCQSEMSVSETYRRQCLRVRELLSA
jgi:hypothetical protein